MAFWRKLHCELIFLYFLLLIMDPVTTLANPVKITFESVFDLTIDQLRDELIQIGHDAKGCTNQQCRNVFVKF